MLLRLCGHDSAVRATHPLAAAGAGRLGRSQSFVTKVETGECRRDVVELRPLARLYRKPVSYFFGEWTVEAASRLERDLL